MNYFADLAGQFEKPFHEEYFTGAAPNSFTDMISEVLPAVVHPDEAFDLALIAHSTPDSRPTRPACYLSNVLAGNPLSFALSEQGVTAPFTAIRVTGEYARDAAFRRAMVISLDQSFLWNGAEAQLPEGTRMPGRDSAVVLVLARDGALGSMSVRNFADVAAGEVCRLVAEQLRDLATSWTPMTTIAGVGVDPELAEDFPIRWAPEDLPCTGVWSELADGLAQWTTTGQRVVLVDYDPILRYLSLCTVDVPGAEPGPLAGV
ncbi:hypothetical protein [Pseudonocardia alaniniphila]|uniref:Uncharacterized protein n=1 Tax=Pseudonocardia alaniniphila TaxID=75291 RepID=A0ABS9TF43_9PSEU|nr:hypothetical protein [Pseudonocardia alaniniphila]MCH6167160.1 hypothetical protein [Pseudonocardia alaniniphila]